MRFSEVSMSQRFLLILNFEFGRTSRRIKQQQLGVPPAWQLAAARTSPMLCVFGLARNHAITNL